MPTVMPLAGRIVTAAWGSLDLLRDLRGAPPGPTREAELWFGAHPAHPAELLLPDGPVALDQAPQELRPQFLLKLLAAGQPLSLQLHPDAERAATGFLDEEERGVPRDAPERCFRDPNAKPEMLRALSPMQVLVGLRPAVESRRMLAALVPVGLDDVLSVLARGDVALPEVLRLLLTAEPEVTAARLAALARGVEAAAADPALTADAALAAELLARHPADHGVLAAMLLRRIELAPGQAVFVPPGMLHAYLGGLGVEVMTPSDNTLRAGLTVKPVDVGAVLAAVDARPAADPHVGSLSVGDGPWRRFLCPSPDFVLEEADLAGEAPVERAGRGPSVLLCARGEFEVRAADGSRARLGPTGAVLLADDTDPVTLVGEGLVLHARSGAAVG
jgi:mannose-6-phosphate isomerase